MNPKYFLNSKLISCIFHTKFYEDKRAYTIGIVHELHQTSGKNNTFILYHNMQILMLFIIFKAKLKSMHDLYDLRLVFFQKLLLLKR